MARSDPTIGTSDTVLAAPKVQAGAGPADGRPVAWQAPGVGRQSAGVAAGLAGATVLAVSPVAGLDDQVDRPGLPGWWSRWLIWWQGSPAWSWLHNHADRLSGPWSRLWARAVTVASLAWRRVQAGLAAITTAGWAVIALLLLGLIAARVWGLIEGAVWAVMAVIVLLAAVLVTLGRTLVTVSLGVDPPRVSVGSQAIVSFRVTNPGPRQQGSVRLRLPVGSSTAHYTTPALAVEESYADWLSIPAKRRQVVDIGPVVTYRSDPLRLIRREITWTDQVQLFIHPRQVALPSFGSGLLRDLEGQSTPDVSNADLAFHTLRDYVPGDDQRYIHWKSSARLSAVAGSPKFMIRQFLDTRRNHLALISDLDSAGFASADEFELALSVAASLATRCLLDEVDLTIICGDELISRPRTNRGLDPYAAAELGHQPLAGQFEGLRSAAPDASLVTVVTGSQTPMAQLRQGRSVIDALIPLLVIRVQLGADIGLRASGGLTELTVGALERLPQAIAGVSA
ncbi:MAG: DUF58 domain-containing protein [Propionibacteriaceae bacterium]|jgi:hypothetical protein|nr:DUF58 domain-containing protein [Propionibacteriaceae bacterium]